MDKSKKSQILKLSLIVALLIITLLIPTTLRPTYLYFVFNLLIIALGAEAGLLSFSSKAADDKKPPIPAKPVAVVASESSPHKEEPPNATGGATAADCTANKPKVVEKCSSEKIGGGAVKVQKVRKCPSTPSIFFIGGGEAEAEEVVEDDDDGGEEEGEQVGDVNGQELFTKAETFIGNFYKQLKMQREESWKRIHGLYQKAF